MYKNIMTLNYLKQLVKNEMKARSLAEKYSAACRIIGGGLQVTLYERLCGSVRVVKRFFSPNVNEMSAGLLAKCELGEWLDAINAA